MTTDRQKRAVRFCEGLLLIDFEGDINNFKQVSDFLHQHLDAAKVMYDELLASSDILDKY